MEKFYTKIIGAPIFEDDSQRAISSVQDIIMDPETGKLIALVTNPSKNLIITFHDIISWNDGIYIHNSDAIIHADEVLRVKKIQENNVKIFNNMVETQNGKILGRVIDLTFDNQLFILKKLYVAKGFLGLIKYDTRIIPAKNIIEILPNKIIVRDDIRGLKITEKKEIAIEEMVTG